MLEGIGQSLGYENDKAFLEHRKAEEAELTQMSALRLMRFAASIRRLLFGS
jgi:hypothetical protein